MASPLSELEARVRAQKTANPAVYGKVDFDIVPERFAREPGAASLLRELSTREERERRPLILADGECVWRALAYTMLGDDVADAYAALMPGYGFRRLVDMLTRACQRGIEAVHDSPPELARFLAAMEQRPDWIDPKLSVLGARLGRVSMAKFTPFVIRGAFLATFTNKYAGHPMALTGGLSGNSSVQRVKETASFFTTATLPGALDRFGTGFRAAAMVRLMHAMVRASLLMKEGRWDVAVYGIPIPQVDQMPAGTMPSLIAANRATRAKRGFNRRERALVELCRHQCFLLGLPRDLLPDQPEAIMDGMATYAATLRAGYDDATNGELVRATMAAYLPPDRTVKSQVRNVVERSVSKVFLKHTLRVPEATARQMGVVPSAFDYGMFAAFQAYVLPRFFGHVFAERVPIARRLADARLVEEINRLLVGYGHAEYTTDPSRYRAA
jgi:hypothetical protein